MSTTVAIAVKTIDRGAWPPKARNYLGATLANFERSGVFESEHLHSLTLVDSGSPKPVEFLRSEVGEPVEVDARPDGPRTFEILPDRRVIVEMPRKRRNLHANAARAIQIAGSAGADWAMVVEDDIDVCGDFLESVVAWLEDHAQPSPMMYVFGANYRQIRMLYRERKTVWRYPARNFYGALCCVWSPADALDVVDWYGDDPAYLDKDGGKIYGRGHDLMLGRWGQDRGVTHFWTSVPCFIQHIGLNSGLGNRRIQYAGWRGPGYSYVNGRQTTGYRA